MEVLRYQNDNGSVEIKIATANIASSWQRFRSRLQQKAETYCDYKASRPGKLWLTDIDRMEEYASLVSDEYATEWLSLPPVMYETNTYSFTIRFAGIEGKPLIVHPNREVADRFNWFADKDNKGGVLSGSIDFINEPGIFPLRYRYKPIGQQERTDTLEIRIVSPKLDTKEDYTHILNAINREYNNLVFKYLTKTFQNFHRGGIENNDLIWLSIFRSIVDEYIKAMEYIVNKPHIRVQKHERFSRAEHIKQWTPIMAQLYAEAEAENKLDRKLFRHELAESTFDTRENRFVKYTIESIGKRLNSVIGKLQRNFDSYLTDDEKAQLKGYQINLIKLQRSRFFRGIGRFDGFKQESLVLQKRTGYREIYRTWFILNSGLSLYEGTTQIGTRPIWELYELWCFLKMKQLVAEIIGIDLESEIDAPFIKENKSTMLDPFKQSEVEHTVIFHKGDAVDRVELKYQHTYNRHIDSEIHTATTEQRPDIVLNIHKSDGFTLTYLYDAKYRVLDDKNAGDMDGKDHDYADYPPSDAINQMHRYRDAIYYGSDRYANTAKEIIGGYILFPGRVTDAKVRERYYFKSIEKVNIGAFPLLPSINGDEDILLKEHLTTILLDKSKYEQLKDCIPQRGLQYHSEDKPFDTDLVLVGYYKTDQWEKIVKNKLYYVPVALGKGSINLTSGFEKTKYLLLHHGDERLLVRLKGDGPKFYPKNALIDMGFSPSGDYYLGFEIKNFTPVSGIDPNLYELERKGKQATIPYFTSMEKLIK